MKNHPALTSDEEKAELAEVKIRDDIEPGYADFIQRRKFADEAERLRESEIFPTQFL